MFIPGRFVVPEWTWPGHGTFFPIPGLSRAIRDSWSPYPEWTWPVRGTFFLFRDCPGQSGTAGCPSTCIGLTNWRWSGIKDVGLYKFCSVRTTSAEHLILVVCIIIIGLYCNGFCPVFKWWLKTTRWVQIIKQSTNMNNLVAKNPACVFT